MDERGLCQDDIRCASDLRKLPVLTKDDVRASGDDLLARNFSRADVAWSRTGGTTGEPIRIAKDRHCSIWEGMCYERGLEWGGLAAGTPRIKLFGGTLGIDGTSWIDRLGTALRGDVLLPAFELTAATAPVYLEKIRRSRAQYAIGYASALYRLAVLAQEAAQGIRFAAVFPTAELLLPEWADAIRRSFQCEILPYYGCGEVNSLGFCARGSRSYLIPEEHCIIEVLRADGTTGLHGDGRLVITSLVNYAMPVLRYVNGDAGEVGPALGDFPFSRIERLDGRYNSLLMTDTGELISGVIGTHVFRHVSASVHSYRIIQEEPLHIVIKVVPRSGRFSRDEEQLIVGLFARHLGPRMRITLERVASLPVLASGKVAFVINRCL